MSIFLPSKNPSCQPSLTPPTRLPIPSSLLPFFPPLPLHLVGLQTLEPSCCFMICRWNAHTLRSNRGSSVVQTLLFFSFLSPPPLLVTAFALFLFLDTCTPLLSRLLPLLSTTTKPHTLLCCSSLQYNVCILFRSQSYRSWIHFSR